MSQNFVLELLIELLELCREWVMDVLPMFEILIGLLLAINYKLTDRLMWILFPNSLIIIYILGTWMLYLLFFLHMHIVQKITQIPLSIFGFEDTLVWPYRRNGMFTVKSCYFALCSTNADIGVPSSLQLNTCGVWSRLSIACPGCEQ